MSTKAAYLPLKPWVDHWNAPTAEALLKEIKETHRTVLPTLREQLRQMPGVEERVVWMGDAWKWAFEYTLPAHHVSGPESPDALAYLVPDPEMPLFVMPIADAFIASLPFKRLNRYIRDGIKSGKLAVDIIWISWAPGPGPELEHLIDVLKRKYRFLVAPPKAGEPAAEDAPVPTAKILPAKAAEHGKKPEAKKPEAKKPEAKKPEAKKSEVKKPEPKKVEAKKPEPKKPEAKKAPAKPAAKKPEAKKAPAPAKKKK